MTGVAPTRPDPANSSRSIDMANTSHLLLTSLGTSPRETTYGLDGRTVRACFAPLALWQLLPESARPHRVVVLVTPEAGVAALPQFEQGAKALGLEVDPCDIPGGAPAADVAAFLRCAAECVPADSRVTLDVTHGLRHHAFLFYSLALYLRSLRGVQIEGAWYGLLEAGGGDTPRPIIDLRPALALADWFHAVRVFRERGTALPIAALVRPFAGASREDAKQAGNDPTLHASATAIEKVAEQLEKVSFAYESALPLELGCEAERLRRQLSSGLPGGLGDQVPLSGELSERIEEAAQVFAFGEPTGSGKWKTAVVLDDKELARQRRLIDLYLERDQLPLALGLMREWVVSWVVKHTGQPKDWLGRTERQAAEHKLGALAAYVRRGRKGELSIPQNEWGAFWNQLASLRNALHHHGMEEDEVKSAATTLASVREFWNDLPDTPFTPLGGGGGRLLVTPLGTRPGVLFSALRKSRPDTCIVVCSRQSEASVTEAARRAGFENAITSLVMDDPHAGVGEIETLIAGAEAELLQADSIDANLTGGTTVMGIAVQKLVDRAGKLDRPVRRFALIDRRPPAEQDAEPWVESDVYWLDRPGETSDADD